MKQLLLLLFTNISVLYCQNIYEKPQIETNLKGSIKKLIETKYIIGSSSEIIKETTKFKTQQIFEFNKQGDLFKQVTYNSYQDDYPIEYSFIYNTSNLLIEKSESHNKEIVGRTFYNYDDDKNNISSLKYSSGDEIKFERTNELLIKEFKIEKNQKKTLYCIYYLDKKMNIIKTDWYNLNGNIVNSFANKYDDKNNKIEEAILTSNGEKFQITKLRYDSSANKIDEYTDFLSGFSHFTFKYDYDEKRNWIKKTTYDVKENKVLSITIRKIIYN